MPTPLAVDSHGNALISFLAAPGEHPPPQDAPTPLALVSLWRGDHVLLVFNRFRRCWELPGGLIDPGESAREAAERELLEESGQVPEGLLRFVGFARFILAPDLRAEYGALFSGRVRGGTPSVFRPDEEICAMRWWDPGGREVERLQPLDAYLARLTRG
ncbi:NUDIX domain-containing protein [Streptomyces sp. NPDC091377]|uniref:NUDIX domain-containing protein n=1 Tax=Streptomyces sp. NPDC091377 TaxID=3365995 RepID=UPI0038076091